MFYITYYAKKHRKFITRKGQYDKPDGTKGKSFVSKNGTPCLVYWDLDNDGWRMATGETKVYIIGFVVNIATTNLQINMLSKS